MKNIKKSYLRTRVNRMKTMSSIVIKEIFKHNPQVMEFVSSLKVKDNE